MSNNTLPGNNKLPGNDEYLRQQANFEHEDDLEELQRKQDMHDDDARMSPVREMWDSNRTAYQDKLNKFIEQAKAVKAKTFSGVLNLARENPDVLEGIKSLTTKTKKGGKSRVFRKKSNKTKTKKVSRRNRRSRNIRRSRNSRAHKRK